MLLRDATMPLIGLQGIFEYLSNAAGEDLLLLMIHMTCRLDRDTSFVDDCVLALITIVKNLD